MMQELLGGSHHGFVVGERKISINNGVLETKPPSLSSSSSHPSSSPTSAAATTTTTTNSSNSENLRCPRCDSSNTKFCYYNNYNLTQPRHFCKTCRRYWTKGGALRNVPIGGGCRKNRNPTMSAAASMVKTSAGKMKTVASTDIGRSGLIGGPFDSEQFQSSPILWGSPQNSHILALLRSTQNPNPSPLSNVKQEGGLIENHMMNDSSTVLNGRSLGLDPLNQGPSLGLCSSSFWRPQHQQQNGFILGEVQNTTSCNGIQELYQRLRSSSTTSNNYNYNDNSAVVLTNQLGSSSSTVYDSASIASGHESSGYWINNSAFSTWSDLPTTTTTGVYPLKN